MRCAGSGLKGCFIGCGGLLLHVLRCISRGGNERCEGNALSVRSDKLMAAWWLRCVWRRGAGFDVAAAVVRWVAHVHGDGSIHAVAVLPADCVAQLDLIKYKSS